MPSTYNASISIEGYWGASPVDTSYPWPVPSTEPWSGKDTFLKALSMVEERAQAGDRTHDIEVWQAKGFSCCRICDCINGTMEFRGPTWAWPEGFRHYVEDHTVRPSRAFEAYILSLL